MGGSMGAGFRGAESQSRKRGGENRLSELSGELANAVLETVAVNSVTITRHGDGHIAFSGNGYEGTFHGGVGLIEMAKLFEALVAGDS
jgi:hypothetical protein